MYAKQRSIDRRFENPAKVGMNYLFLFVLCSLTLRFNLSQQRAQKSDVKKELRDSGNKKMERAKNERINIDKKKS